MSEYSQGVCEDGAAILKDGLPMTIEQILNELRSAQKPIAVVPEGLALVPAIATREIEDAIGRNRNLKASEIWEVAVSVASKNVQQPIAVVPEWIKCSERLTNERCLAYTPNNEDAVITLRIVPTRMLSHLSDVTHWMHLPEPPKQDPLN
jgi:hypothetical protein